MNLLEPPQAVVLPGAKRTHRLGHDDDIDEPEVSVLQKPEEPTMPRGVYDRTKRKAARAAPGEGVVKKPRAQRQAKAPPQRPGTELRFIVDDAGQFEIVAGDQRIVMSADGTKRLIAFLEKHVVIGK